MKKLSYLCGALLFFGATANAQLIDEKDVTVTMDLQPVLQLDMSTPDQIEFVFDEINEYYAGITKYGATQLRVSSTVNWDLYAVGRSTGTNGAELWDQQLVYGNGTTANAIADLPLSLLELRQSQANSGAAGATGTADYSGAFSPAATPAATNSLYVNGGLNTAPLAADKYIAGHATAGDFMVGGSYLTAGGTSSDFFYVMDYRILPGLPAIFPMAFDADGVLAEDLVTASGNAAAYAQPGVYTMYVQYILLEDQ